MIDSFRSIGLGILTWPTEHSDHEACPGGSYCSQSTELAGDLWLSKWHSDGLISARLRLSFALLGTPSNPHPPPTTHPHPPARYTHTHTTRYHVPVQAAFLQLECGGALARLLAAIASPDAAASHAAAGKADEAQVLPTSTASVASLSHLQYDIAASYAVCNGSALNGSVLPCDGGVHPDCSYCHMSDTCATRAAGRCDHDSGGSHGPHQPRRVPGPFRLQGAPLRYRHAAPSRGDHTLHLLLFVSESATR